MIIDFRYHVASLVAVFIALALGILIGSTLVGQDFLENMAKEQQLWIGKLEQDYLNLKKETDSLRLELAHKQSQLDYYQNFALKIKPYLVEGKLNGKKFAIIELDRNGPFLDVVNILEQSGAKIVSSTRFLFADKLTEKYDLHLLLEHAANLILKGEKTELTDLMEEANFIKSIGTYGDLLDGIIIVKGFNKQEKILVETQNFIANYFKDKIPLYIINGEEPIDKRNNWDLYVVNKLETIPGQVNLVMTIFENLNETALTSE